MPLTGNPLIDDPALAAMLPPTTYMSLARQALPAAGAPTFYAPLLPQQQQPAPPPLDPNQILNLIMGALGMSAGLESRALDIWQQALTGALGLGQQELNVWDALNQKVLDLQWKMFLVNALGEFEGKETLQAQLQKEYMDTLRWAQAWQNAISLAQMTGYVPASWLAGGYGAPPPFGGGPAPRRF